MLSNPPPFSFLLFAVVKGKIQVAQPVTYKDRDREASQEVEDAYCNLQIEKTGVTKTQMSGTMDMNVIR